MNKVIKLDPTRRADSSSPGGSRCEHKYVTVYASVRVVSCTLCGAKLDPFDVLLDLVKGHVPAAPHRDEERALALEIVKRKNKSRRSGKKSD